MRKRADYIQSIEIQALWKGGRHIIWNLRPDVNILSGINGVGKSTIINYMVKKLDTIDRDEIVPKDAPKGVAIKLMPEDATYIKFDVIRSFDRPLLHSDLLEKLSDSRVKTELDWLIYRANSSYNKLPIITQLDDRYRMLVMLFRLSVEQRVIPQNNYAKYAELIERIGRQVTGWKQYYEKMGASKA